MDAAYGIGLLVLVALAPIALALVILVGAVLVTGYGLVRPYAGGWGRSAQATWFGAAVAALAMLLASILLNFGFMAVEIFSFGVVMTAPSLAFAYFAPRKCLLYPFTQLAVLSLLLAGQWWVAAGVVTLATYTVVLGLAAQKMRGPLTVTLVAICLLLTLPYSLAIILYLLFRWLQKSSNGPPDRPTTDTPKSRPADMLTG